MAATPTKQDFTLIQKTTKTYQLQFKQDGAYVDITDWIVFFTVKVNMVDPDVSAVISKTITTHTDPTNGETEIVLSSTDTNQSPKSYFYDIKVKDDSSPSNIFVVLTGRLTIERIVTQRES
jgi:hypothetical protein